jgi:ABC-type multidrug transport system permease subunit
MNLNVIVDFLHELFYSTFEVLPMIGWAANYFFLVVMFMLFIYWLTVLNKKQKKNKK